MERGGGREGEGAREREQGRGSKGGSGSKGGAREEEGRRKRSVGALDGRMMGWGPPCIVSYNASMQTHTLQLLGPVSERLFQCPEPEPCTLSESKSRSKRAPSHTHRRACMASHLEERNLSNASLRA